MSVEFDEESRFNAVYNKSASKQSQGLTLWLISKGIVKDEKSAKSLMIVITIICFGLTFFLIFK